MHLNQLIDYSIDNRSYYLVDRLDFTYKLVDQYNQQSRSTYKLVDQYNLQSQSIDPFNIINRANQQTDKTILQSTIEQQFSRYYTILIVQSMNYTIVIVQSINRVVYIDYTTLIDNSIDRLYQTILIVYNRSTLYYTNSI